MMKRAVSLFWGLLFLRCVLVIGNKCMSGDFGCGSKLCRNKKIQAEKYFCRIFLLRLGFDFVLVFF